MGLTDDGGLVLQLSIHPASALAPPWAGWRVHDDGQINDMRAWVDGAGWLPLRAFVRGATWQQPHSFTAPATLTAVFGQGVRLSRYQGHVEAKSGGRWGRWSTVASFDWTPGAATARLTTSRPAVRRVTTASSMAPRRPQRARSDRLGRLLSWLDRLGG
jgi:hypothetical protein